MRCSITSCLIIWGLQVAALSLASTPRTQQSHAAVQHAKSRGHAGCSTNGQLFRPAMYIPSHFEREWGEIVVSGNEDGCSFIRSNAHRVEKWLAIIQGFYSLELDNGYNKAVDFISEVPSRNESVVADMTEDIFSRMIYKNICPGEFFGTRKEIALEPLVGHFRHPYGLKGCVPDLKQEHSIVDLNYILAVPWAAADLNAMFPGTKYLFDLGSSDFGSSMQFLTTRYRQAGMDFKSIWAWEASLQEPKDYWHGVPDTYRQRLHFYNTPITDDFREASHPLNIIRSICEPGDFIVVKLDIDNGPLENAIMQEIHTDQTLRHCISEIFYEQHYDHADFESYQARADALLVKTADCADMTNSFGLGNGANLRDVFQGFSTSRQSGLLLHYWP